MHETRQFFADSQEQTDVPPHTAGSETSRQAAEKAAKHARQIKAQIVAALGDLREASADEILTVVAQKRGKRGEAIKTFIESHRTHVFQASNDGDRRFCACCGHVLRREFYEEYVVANPGSIVKTGRRGETYKGNPACTYISRAEWSRRRERMLEIRELVG